MKGSSPHFHIVGLQDHAALVGPIRVERQDNRLKVSLSVGKFCHGGHWRTEPVGCKSGAPYPCTVYESIRLKRKNEIQYGQLRRLQFKEPNSGT